jgi:hypothetical protein
MLLSAGILASVGSLFIFAGAFMQAARTFSELMGEPRRRGGVEVPDSEFARNRFWRWYFNTRWFTSSWRLSSFVDRPVYHAWMLILIGSFLMLAGSLVTVAAA